MDHGMDGEGNYGGSRAREEQRNGRVPMSGANTEKGTS